MRSTITPNSEDQPERSWAEDRQSLTIPPVSGGDSTTPLPEHLSQSISAITAMYTHAEQNVSQHQRAVEGVTAFFGRPVFLYSILLVVALWVLPNILPRRNGIPHFDPPPFNWLGETITLSSFLMTTGVLVTQNRQEKLAQRQADLILQLNLLTEQKTAKIIALVEELRDDIPSVRDRHDPEAEVMKQSADPHTVIKALEEGVLEQHQETSA